MSELASAGPVSAPPLRLELRVRFSAMMFLEFAIWGAWYVVLGNYLGALGFSGTDIGSIYATIPLGAMVAPMFIGTIADRYFSTEKLLAALHLAGACLLWWMAQIETPRMFYWVALTYALVYSPTLALVNSICFSHVPDGTRDFPGIRVLGTIGWIVAGFALKPLLGAGQAVTNMPLYLASVLSLVLGLFSLVLPHTPPPSKRGEAIPFLRAFGLLKDFSFAVFFGVSFLITLVVPFYFNFAGLFLEKAVGVKPENIAPLMTVGQFVEMMLLPLLPWFLGRWGMKWVLVAGMGAWALRYGCFSFGQPFWIVLAGIALHGVCFDFFFAAGFIHVDNEAPASIRASGQSLYGFLTYGLGMWLGGEVSGRVVDSFTTNEVVDWTRVWLGPSLCAAAACLAFVLLFRYRARQGQAAG